MIYELHVRGFTARHPAIPEALRGTFAGLAHPAARAHLKRLGTIPGSTLFEVTPNRKADLFGNEIDIVVYAEFPDIEALHAYKRHPTYMEVTNAVRPRRELRFAADVEA